MTLAGCGAEIENWEVLASFLPAGWAEQAWELGAMRRARYISEPAVLLRVLLMHLAAGCSLAETAARAKAAGLAQISGVGVFKRLRASEPWLRWLAQGMRGPAQATMPALGRRLRAVDATSVSEPGSTGSDFKLHYSVNLADLQCDFFQLTPIRQGGETFKRLPVLSGDIIMGDRVYASPPGIAHVVNSGGDVVVRLNRAALPVYESNGKRMDLLPALRLLEGARPNEYATQAKTKNGNWITGRMIALRQSAEVTDWARKRLKRRAQRSRLNLTTEAMEFAEYFMVWTTLPITVKTEQVLELYRLRWQIELVFKRMKTILGLGHLPKKDAVSSKAWLEGKLFVGLLIERMIRTGESFFPWGYPLATASQPMA